MSINIADNKVRLTVFGYGWNDQKASDNGSDDASYLADIAADLGYQFDAENIDWPAIEAGSGVENWVPLYVDDTNLTNNGDGTWTYTDHSGIDWTSLSSELDGDWTDPFGNIGIPEDLFPPVVDEDNLEEYEDPTLHEERWRYTDEDGDEWQSLSDDIFGDWENLDTGETGFPEDLMLDPSEIDGTMYIPEEVYTEYSDMIAEMAYDTDMINDYSFDTGAQSEGCPERIIVEVPPTKTEYEEGETIDFTGIVVGAYSSATTMTPYIFADGTNHVPFGELVFPVTVATKAESPTPAVEPYTPPETIYHAKAYKMAAGLVEGDEYGTYIMGGQEYTAQECIDNGWLIEIDDSIRSADDVNLITTTGGGYKKVVRVIH